MTKRFLSAGAAILTALCLMPQPAWSWGAPYVGGGTDPLLTGIAGASFSRKSVVTDVGRKDEWVVTDRWALSISQGVVVGFAFKRQDSRSGESSALMLDGVLYGRGTAFQGTSRSTVQPRPASYLDLFGIHNREVRNLQEIFKYYGTRRDNVVTVQANRLMGHGYFFKCFICRLRLDGKPEEVTAHIEYMDGRKITHNWAFSSFRAVSLPPSSDIEPDLYEKNTPSPAWPPLL